MPWTLCSGTIRKYRNHHACRSSVEDFPSTLPFLISPPVIVISPVSWSGVTIFLCKGKYFPYCSIKIYHFIYEPSLVIVISAWSIFEPCIIRNSEKLLNHYLQLVWPAHLKIKGVKFLIAPGCYFSVLINDNLDSAVKLASHLLL